MFWFTYKIIEKTITAFSEWKYSSGDIKITFKGAFKNENTHSGNCFVTRYLT